MAKQPMHPRLSDHNVRVLRLARDYDKKFRPVVIPLGKRMNLETGDSFPRVQVIMRDSARYTDNRKPLSRSQVFKLMAEMAGAGALKTEPRFGPTGRQRSSIRYLDVHVAIRFGQPVEHLWDAPLPGDETPGKTPHETPDETPITLSVSLKNSPSNSVRTGEKGASPSREIERGPGAARRDKDAARPSVAQPGQDRAQRDADTRAKSSGICNTYIAWEVKGTGKRVMFRKDKPPREKPPKGAKVVELSPAEASFMWRCVRKDYRPGFVLATPGARANWMSAQSESDAWDCAERDNRPTADELARQHEIRSSAERAELEPLIQRYAELSGEDAADICDWIDKRGMPHRVNLVGLQNKIWRKEAERRAS